VDDKVEAEGVELLELVELLLNLLAGATLVPDTRSSRILVGAEPEGDLKVIEAGHGDKLCGGPI
jgi:hypothetical protein